MPSFFFLYIYPKLFRMKRIILLSLLVALYLHSFAGWEIVTRYYNSTENPQNARLEHVFFTKGYMKIISGSVTTIYNLQKQEITYFNSNNKKYWQGNSTKFNTDVKEDMRRKMEQDIQNADKSQQARLREMYDEMFKSTFSEEETSSGPSNAYSVKVQLKEQTISGYKSVSYQVYENVMPLEVIWLATDLKIAQEFDFRSFSNLLQTLVKGSYGSSFESSDQYFKLLDLGYPMRIEMKREDEKTYISEVIKVTKTNFKESDFKVPQGYTSSTLTDVGVWDIYH